MTKQFFAIENINVGEVKQSILTEAQFSTEYGEGWVLMDGRDITGSDLATITGNTTLPDARGIFLRGKNNGRSDGSQNPDGDLAIGTTQADEVGGHDHPGVKHTPYGYDIYFSIGNNQLGYADNRDEVTGTSGGNESRPTNITVNTFIKINR